MKNEQSSESEQKPSSNVSPVSPIPVSSAEPEKESTSGTSQNALEYLTGEPDHATGITNEEPTAGEAEGTLSIQDLLNAQDLGDSADPESVATPPDKEQIPDESEPDTSH